MIKQFGMVKNIGNHTKAPRPLTKLAVTMVVARIVWATGCINTDGRSRSDKRRNDMYKYYAEKESKEHYLFSNEIADLLNKGFGIQNEKGGLATRMVEAFLNDYEERYGMPRLFYNTRHGLRRVYPFGFELAMHANKVLDISPGLHVLYVGGRNFKYKVVGRPAV